MKSPYNDSFVVQKSETTIKGYIFLAILEAVLAQKADFRFAVRGSSMAPLIREGDIVTISPLPPQGPSTGDIAGFVRGKRLCIHRVIGRAGRDFLMKGDGAPCADGVVPHENILGRVTGVERSGQKVCAGLGPAKRLIAAMSRAGLLAFTCRIFSSYTTRSIAN